MAKSMMEHFGILTMPWIIRVYLFMFLATIMLILLPGLNIFNYSESTISEIVGIGKDALKIIIGAVIGSLSMAAQKEWGKPDSKEEE